MGVLPPIRFVPEGDLNTDKEGRNHIKIQISEHATKSFELFVEGGPEAVILLIRSHESIVQDQNLCEIYKSVSALINTKKTAVLALNALTNKSDIDKLNNAINELKPMCISTQQEVFDYFEQLLSQSQGHIPK